MQIIENKALLLNVRNPGRITTVIPKSKDMGDGKVLVHWNLEEAQVLKNLQIKDVPSPILGKYNWPGRYKPFEHQKDTASFLTLHRRAFCLNEQGTGKTGSAIWAADYLMKIGKIKRVLIVCPLSIMDSAWRGDLFNFAMHRTADIAYGAKDKRVKIINGGAEFIIINYDGLNIVEEEIKKGGFDLIIVDEANAYKNAQTTRWKTLNRILTPDTWLWMMTGTPAAQSPVDAYGLAKLVNPKNVPTFFTAFKDMVMTKVTTFKWVVRPNADKVVFEALQPAIRYTKEECLDLPEMTYVVRDVELTPQQKKYYEALRKQLVVQTTGEQITAVNAAVGLNKLLQISCGAVYADSGETLHFDISNRYKVLREVVDETRQKVLIFVPFKHTIELLREKLTTDGFVTDVISGEVSAGKRADIFRRFQTQPDPRILIIQPQAAAHGVTLTAADTIVWWGPTSSLETYAQANARAHRAGQRHPVTVVKLQGSNAEKHVYRMLDNRITENGKLIDLYKTLLD
jgi:SNF2 family DNA or RNA helicase